MIRSFDLVRRLRNCSCITLPPKHALALPPWLVEVNGKGKGKDKGRDKGNDSDSSQSSVDPAELQRIEDAFFGGDSYFSSIYH